MSRDGRVCNNKEDINAPGDDYGSRAGSCRVCDNEYRATAKYDEAVAVAQSQYDATVNAAWSKKLEAEAAATYVIDTVRHVFIFIVYV